MQRSLDARNFRRFLSKRVYTRAKPLALASAALLLDRRQRNGTVDQSVPNALQPGLEKTLLQRITQHIQRVVLSDCPPGSCM